PPVSFPRLLLRRHHPGAGLHLQNSMINFYPYAGHPNSIAPRKGRTGGMAPTIVYQRETGEGETGGRGDRAMPAVGSSRPPVSPSPNRPLLVLGSPGATRIITAHLQATLNVLDFGISISDAVLAPRLASPGDVTRDR